MIFMANTLFIDGGGTKTAALLIKNEDFKIINSIKLDEMSNLYFNYDKTIETFKKLYLEVEEWNFEKIFISIAGYSETIKTHVLFKELLKKMFGCNDLIIMKDIEFLSKAYCKSDKDLVMILGTGSAYVGMKNNKLKQFGGWGHLFGDEGSSYSFSQNIIKLAIDEGEVRESKLKASVYKYFKVNTDEEFKKIIYSIEEKNEIANLSKFIISSREHDNIIEKIFNKEAALVFMKVMNFDKENKIENIYLDGGFVRNNPMYLKILKAFFSKTKITLIDWTSLKDDNPIIKILKTGDQ